MSLTRSLPATLPRLLATALITITSLMTIVAARADVTLVGALTPDGSAWDSQANVPPSGPVFNFADQFSLNSGNFVTDIRVSLFGFSGFPSTPFNLAVVTALDSTSPLFSADLVLGNTSADFNLPVNSILSGGTYFLRITTAGFVGWPVAKHSSEVNNAGTVDGIWERNPAGVWSFQGDLPGIFSVNGPSPTNVPAPASWSISLLALGLLSLARLRTRTSRGGS